MVRLLDKRPRDTAERFFLVLLALCVLAAAGVFWDAVWWGPIFPFRVAWRLCTGN